MTSPAGKLFSATLPRNYYLLVHDACRHVLGPKAKLTAFVKAKKPFQCDMLVQSTAFDPPDDVVLPGRRLVMTPPAPNGTNVDAERRRKELADTELIHSAHKTPDYVTQFGFALQSHLGICDVQAHRRRLDVVFRDRQVMRVALSAKLDIKNGTEINSVGAWQKRNALRIALGYDEELFQAACDMNINLASRSLEKSLHDTYQVSPVLELHPQLREAYVAANGNWRAVSPPITYWQAHCYALCRSYPCRHVQEILCTVQRNFTKYYGRFPFVNPYCEDEDLNTMDAARFACEVWSLQPSLAALNKEEPSVGKTEDGSPAAPAP